MSTGCSLGNSYYNTIYITPFLQPAQNPEEERISLGSSLWIFVEV